MKAELKARWLTALRSGTYVQAREHLHTPEGFCCLGVLCDVAGAEWKKNVFGNMIPRWPGGVSMGFFALNKPEDFGLTSTIQNALMKKNDLGTSFAEIADWIETNVEEDPKS